MQRQTRYMERTNSINNRGKRTLTLEEEQPECKRPALASVIVEALKMDSLQKLCSSLEPILRRVVSEEVERALAKIGPPRLNGRASPKRIEGPDGRNLQLKLRSCLSLPLYTGGKVEGERGAAIHVVLTDANTDHAVTHGPEASVKLDVVALEGDFNNEEDEGWTREEFESHVVKEREGRRPILIGDLQVTLKEGVGTLGGLSFTDNSSWIRSRKFRLGLRVASGFCEGTRIREAKSEAFTVRDHRGELYKKHYPPALEDEVWRLEKIAKDGSFHKRLNNNGIFTVEDFLRLVDEDEQKLRKILGSGMSNNKMWDALLKHAKTCLLGGKFYVYQDGTTTYSTQSQLIASNPHPEFLGISYTGQDHIVDTPNHGSSMGLAFVPLQPSSFQNTEPSNLNSYEDWSGNSNRADSGCMTEDEIRMRSHEMLGNEDVQHLLHLFSMDSHASITIPEDGFGFGSDSSYWHCSSSSSSSSSSSPSSSSALPSDRKCHLQTRTSIPWEHAFANAGNLEHCAKYLNQTLVTFGFPASLDLFSNDPVSIARTCNCIYSLLQQRQRDIEFRESANDQRQRLFSDISRLEAKVERLDSQIQAKDREIATITRTEAKNTAHFKAQIDKLHQERDEFQRMVIGNQQVRTQQIHEMKKKEKEYMKLQERLNQVLMEKKKESKSGIEIMNLLQKEGRQRGTWNGKKADTDFYKKIVDAYEAKNQDLMAENNDLRALLRSMQTDMRDFLNAPNRPTKHSQAGNGRGESDITQSPLGGKTDVFDLPLHMARNQIEESLRNKMSSIKERMVQMQDSDKGSEVTSEATERELELEAQLVEARSIIQEQASILSKHLAEPERPRELQSSISHPAAKGIDSEEFETQGILKCSESAITQHL
ncbi:hypothetical protein SAY86_030319 [Trapa natans]|uniref:Uncharacterized protein n=1 Tax=Trapa natans TaxID=22666 RepID=A0AAN7MR95_TRANT|nr:hypothetical protein SAY86_030319 [Trapa natans]